MTRWSLFLQTLSLLLHHFLGLYWPEAEIARGLLGTNGIKPVVLADDMGGWRPEMTLVRGARLLVKQEDAEEAIKVLGNEEKNGPK